MKTYRALMGVAVVAAAVSVPLLFWAGDEDAAARPGPGTVEKSTRAEPTALAVADAAVETGGSWISFLSHRTGRNLLYKMRPDGGEPQPFFGGEIEAAPGLAEGAVWWREPHWSRQSPDGRFFLSWAVDRGLPVQRHKTPPRFLLHLGRMEGGPTRLITPDAEEIFTWSPDSRRFAYARSLWNNPMNLFHHVEPRTQLVVAAVDGSGETVILDRPGLWAPLDWSLDGARLLVSYGSSPSIQSMSMALFELDIAKAEADAESAGLRSRGAEKGDAESVPEGGGLRAILPLKRGLGAMVGRYSPDGKTIAVVRSTLQTEGDALIAPARYVASFELGLLDPDGRAYRVIYKPEKPILFSGPICWSPDGRSILFAQYDRPEQVVTPDPDPDSDVLSIWSIGRDGGEPRRITGGWSADWRSAPAQASSPSARTAPDGSARVLSGRVEKPAHSVDPDAAANSLKTVGVGIMNFQQARPGSKVEKLSRLPVDRQASWIVAVLPHLTRGDLHDRIHAMVTDGDDRPWDDAANRGAVSEVVAPLVTPEMAESGTVRDPSGAGLTGIVGISGTGPDSPALPEGSRDPSRGYFGYYRIARPDEVTDGASSTAMLMEARSRRGPWAQNGPSTTRPIESFEGGLVLMADGSVRSLTRTTDPKLLRAMSTIAAKD
ncbi:MAG: DUF1559 domain-containing protein [Paludisphaera borealis]|uniref:DUF1559 family PulG-like putative transporter n=1 Tax=Paludisphaera borealis TaxID=1387353 RepID=UPI00284B127D|nr:DUF1559 domain-containing protein [Paludisphaera borealis]MDR3618553.1 DUF1559 domain-containing protein [Paludisphaera borealis]